MATILCVVLVIASVIDFSVEQLVPNKLFTFVRSDNPIGCYDKIPTCHHFKVESDACNTKSSYYRYIEPNCEATCDICSNTKEECQNLIDESYCKFFDDTYMACNPLSTYFYFVSANCKSYCEVCNYHGQLSTCEDYVKEGDCKFFQEAYDGCSRESTYYNFVSAHCSKFCGLCTPLNETSCVDSLQDPRNVTALPTDVCHENRHMCHVGGTVGMAMKFHCKATCGTCSET